MTEQTAATVVKDGGDPSGTGTPQTTDRNAETEAERIKKLEAALEQSKAEKETLERTKAERDALKQQIDSMTSQPPTPGIDPVQANIQAKYQELLYRANVLQDPDAQFQLAQMIGIQQTMAAARRDAQLSGLPDGERAMVEALLKANPALDVPTARQIVKGQEAQKALQDREAKEAEAKKLAEEMARAGGSGVTAVRPAPASDAKGGTIKASELRARYDALNLRIKDGDRAARAEALKLSREVDSGSLKVILNE